MDKVIRFNPPLAITPLYAGVALQGPYKSTMWVSLPLELTIVKSLGPNAAVEETKGRPAGPAPKSQVPGGAAAGRQPTDMIFASISSLVPNL
jgi:hypothetical protein